MKATPYVALAMEGHRKESIRKSMKMKLGIQKSSESSHDSGSVLEDASGGGNSTNGSENFQMNADEE